MDPDYTGRCESCGKYVPEWELNSVGITINDETSEYLWCIDCYTQLEELINPGKQ